MKNKAIALVWVVILTAITLTGKSEIFRAEGNSFCKSDQHSFRDEIVEVFFFSGQPDLWTAAQALSGERRIGCVADFDYNQNSIEEPVITFINLTTGDSLVYLWDFGDGNISTDSIPVHLYPEAGIYEVKLLITGTGCLDSITKQVEVLAPPPCQAAFSFSSESPESLEIFFTNESSGMINGYHWDFDDGTTSNEENPLHTYSQPGDYLVWLNIDAVGCSDSIAHLVQIAEPAFCLAAFTFTQEHPESPVISFINQSGGESFTSFWDFGDGNLSNEENPVHTYSQPGGYLVWLKIETTGCSDSTSKLIQIDEPEFCNAAFSFIHETNPTHTLISFINESEGNSFTSFWDFGDGNFSNEENPVHTYSQQGDYLVWLKIETTGCSDSTSQLIQIDDPEFCNAAFSFIQETNPTNTLILFINASEGESFTSLWDFGDGNTSTETNPQHEYFQPGMYDVKLIITTVGGCSDSIIQTIEIFPFFIISGSVLAGTNLIGYGNIYLYKMGSFEDWIIYDQAPLGTGNFSFSGLTPGSYLVQAIPDFDFPFPVFPNYLPAYFDEAGYWPEAQILSTQNLPESVTVNLLRYDDFFDGDATISGKVNLLPPHSGMPLIVYLTSESGEIFDFSVAEASGAFSFSEIPYGNYRLYPEKAGKTGQSLTIEVTETNPVSQNIVFIEEEKLIYPDLTMIAEKDINTINIYPNPSGDHIYVDLENEYFMDKPGNLIILTTDGKVVLKVTNLSNRNQMDISALAEGLYFLCFEIGNEIFHAKLIIQR